jgi:hypothetical protein
MHSIVVTAMTPGPKSRRPTELFRLLAVNALAGTVAAVVVVVGLLWLDVGRLGSLVAASDQPALPVALMTVGFVVTLASAAMGTAIMRIGRDDADGPVHGRRVPVRVRSNHRRR